MKSFKYLFFTLILTTSCGVKGPPKAPPGTALSPWVDSYFYTPKITPTPSTLNTPSTLGQESNDLIHTTGKTLDQNLIKPAPTPTPSPSPLPTGSDSP